MVELSAKTPCAGMLPVTIGDLALTEVVPGALTSLAPLKGQITALSSVLKVAHGMDMPGVNRATGKGNARAIWFAQGQVMLIGPTPDARLADHAVMTDQSDAWAVVRLQGSGADDVLARLVPVDLRGLVFKRGHTVRTELKHMMASITRVGSNGFQIMVFRSMAHTLVHDLKTAMEAVAARG